MEFPPPTLEEPFWGRAGPEPHMPPGLNREQTWAWALDHFEALSRRSCGCPPPCSTVGAADACGLPRWADAGHGTIPRVEKGQKRCRDPHAPEPKAETTKELLLPQEEADATGSGIQWRLNQPGEARACEGMVPPVCLEKNKTEWVCLLNNCYVSCGSSSRRGQQGHKHITSYYFISFSTELPSTKLPHSGYAEFVPPK